MRPDAEDRKFSEVTATLPVDFGPFSVEDLTRVQLGCYWGGTKPSRKLIAHVLKSALKEGVIHV